MQDQRISVSLATSVIVVLLVVSLASTGVSVTTTHAVQNTTARSAQMITQSTPSQSYTHTLVIIGKNESANYGVSLSGRFEFRHREPTDAIAGTTITGSVGPGEDGNDPKDVIHFSGTLFGIEHNGNISVRLDGKKIDPDTLANTPNPTPTTTPNIVPSSSPTTTTASTRTTTTIIQPTTMQSKDTTPPSSLAANGSGSGALSKLLVGGVIGLVVVLMAVFLGMLLISRE